MSSRLFHRVLRNLFRENLIIYYIRKVVLISPEPQFSDTCVQTLQALDKGKLSFFTTDHFSSNEITAACCLVS